jgi:hypothetical protein
MIVRGLLLAGGLTLCGAAVACFAWAVFATREERVELMIASGVLVLAAWLLERTERLLR